MALTQTQTLADITTTAPDAAQLLDVFAALQSNTDVVMDASASSNQTTNMATSTATADDWLEPTASNIDDTGARAFDKEPSVADIADEQSGWSESEAKTEAEPVSEFESEAYLVDVNSELAVKVQAYEDTGNWAPSEQTTTDWQASDNTDSYAEANEDDEASEEDWNEDAYAHDEAEWSEEDKQDEAWEDQDTYSEDESAWSEEDSEDEVAYAEDASSEVVAVEIDAEQATSVASNDRIDLSWLGAKFAHYGLKMDVDLELQAPTQTEEVYAQDSSASEDYTDVEISGDIDLEQDAYYA